MKYIKYIGKDLILDVDHSIERYRGKKVLTNGSIYRLEYPYSIDYSINKYTILYIYDDINDGENRGYELNISDIEPIREHNLNIILN